MLSSVGSQARGPPAPPGLGHPFPCVTPCRPSWGAPRFGNSWPDSHRPVTGKAGSRQPHHVSASVGARPTASQGAFRGAPRAAGSQEGPWPLLSWSLLLPAQSQAARVWLLSLGAGPYAACPGPGAGRWMRAWAQGAFLGASPALARGPAHSPLPAPAAGPDTLPASVRGYSRSWWPPSGP